MSNAVQMPAGRTRTSPLVVVVTGDPETAAKFRRWTASSWRSRVTTNPAVDPDGFEDSVSVALVDDRTVPDPRSVACSLRSSAPDCKVAVVVEEATSEDGDTFDEVLERPTRGADVRETVRQLLLRSTFEAHAEEYFDLASERAALERRHDAETLAVDDRYQRLGDRLVAVADAAEEILVELDERGGFEGVCRSL